jgi:signal peptidase II
MRIHFLFFLLFCNLLYSDIWTKKWVLFHLSEGSALKVCALLNLSLVHNRGISFGLLSRYDFITPYVLACFGGLLTLLLFYYYVRSHEKIERLALTFMISGALGNIIDRLINLSVIDFLDFHWRDHHWFTFNLADVYVSLGVALIFFKEAWHFFYRRKKQVLSC